MRMNLKVISIIKMFLVLIVMSFSAYSFAQNTTATMTILHSFEDGSVVNDGAIPNAGPVQAPDGNFYSTTSDGGAQGAGCLFRFTPEGNVTILHSFDSSFIANDGIDPWGGLLPLSSGELIGSTTQGGASGSGIVFSVSQSDDYKILAQLSAPADPVDALILGQDGNYYGTSYDGGSAGLGAVFKVSPSGLVSVMHSFGDGSAQNDGANPTGALVQLSNGVIYGTTMNGGSRGEGTIFSFSDSIGFTILHSFGVLNSDGASPWIGLVDGQDGYLYGSTTVGGTTGAGVVYRMAPDGTTTILHTFQDGSVQNDGNYGNGLFRGADGNFFGTTKIGGDGNNGTIFEMTPGGAVSILHSFDDGSTPNDGSIPCTTLTQGSDGNLYGTTATGGTEGQGTIFKLTLGTNLSSPSITLPSGLNLFSLPYTYSNTSLDSLFGYFGVNLAAWSPSSSGYLLTSQDQLSQTAIGLGYWGRFPNLINITASGTPADTTQNFTINLTQGWDMIGDPFTTSIPISSLVFSSGTMTYSQATSGNTPLIGPILWKYDQSSNSYKAASSLDAEGGYWVYAFQTTDMQIPHP